MYPIVGFLEDLHEYLTGTRSVHGNIIRKHSKKLEGLGDISFPLDLKKWSQIIDIAKLDKSKASTVFDYLSSQQDLKTHLEFLLKMSNNWTLICDSYKIKDSDVHLHLQRLSTINLCVRSVLEEGSSYGLQSNCCRINLTIDATLESDITKMTLTELRVFTIRDVTTNILNSLMSDISNTDCDIKITLNSNENQKSVKCGSVLNEDGVKDTKTTAVELFKKRSLDMQLMAQHKYGIQIKPAWRDYFEKLGKSSVTMEMLQNRTHKSLKITLNSLQSANKGPSFIFYNCARISALLKQFDDHVGNNVYPKLPPIDNVDFGLLNQPEEWEMVYVFILQFPVVVVNCICDIKLGVVNLHQLVFFLSSLSSVFSVYYRRVKILTNPKEHLLPVMYARIYLIKAVQQVFHTALRLLNIEPVKEM